MVLSACYPSPTLVKQLSACYLPRHLPFAISALTSPTFELLRVKRRPSNRAMIAAARLKYGVERRRGGFLPLFVLYDFW